MNRKSLLIGLAAGILMTACVDETRKGQLVLSGAAPVRIIDESGKTVEFVNGAVKVEFSADSGRKFTVSMEQESRKAKFSGRAPNGGRDWNFTLRGREIGQLVDMASRRDVELYGQPSTSIGTGNSCGFDGRWVTEDVWQKGNEDWKVAFTDAQTSQAVGSFNSRREGVDFLISSRNLWCREQPRHDPPFPRGPRGNLSKAEGAVKKLSTLAESGVKFD